MTFRGILPLGPTGDYPHGKLGPDDDIEHELAGLVSTVYGSVAQFLRRPLVHP